jgi:hypothetical protein
MKKMKIIWIVCATELVAVREYAKWTRQNQANTLPLIIFHYLNSLRLSSSQQNAYALCCLAPSPMESFSLIPQSLLKKGTHLKSESMVDLSHPSSHVKSSSSLHSNMQYSSLY